MIIQRRNFLIGLGAALAAPAIVKAESLMKVRAIKGGWITEYYNNRVIRTWIDIETIRDKNILVRTAIPQVTWRALNQGVPYAKSLIDDLTFIPAETSQTRLPPSS